MYAVHKMSIGAELLRSMRVYYNIIIEFFPCSVHVCFLHYSKKLCLTYFTIAIFVSFVNHFLEIIWNK